MFVSSGWPESIGDDAELRPYFCRQEELSVQSGCILWGARVVVPLKARERVIDMIHEGHPGIVRMKMFARNYVWWPKLDQDLESGNIRRGRGVAYMWTMLAHTKAICYL